MEPISDVLPSFVGKTVTFYSRSWESSCVIAVISSPTFEVQAGRLFLVGEASTSSDSWARGGHAAVAWDDVSSYMVIDSDEFQRMQVLRKKKGNSEKASTVGGLLSFLRRR